MLRTFLAALLIGLAIPATASAQMAVGFQGDATILDGQGIGREASLDTVRNAGGQWIRIAVQEQDFHQRSGAYLETVTQAKARGLKVLVTLMRWRGISGNLRPGATPAEWQAFVDSAVPYLGPYVDAWGTTNEPNHPAFAPAQAIRCALSPRGASSTVVKGGRFLAVRYRKSSRGTHRKILRWQRVAKKGTHRLINGRYVAAKRHGRYVARVVYRRTREGAYARRARVVRRGLVRVSSTFAYWVCVQQAKAVAYRRIHDLTARRIRSSDPGAKVLVGDLAPAAGSVAFMEAMFGMSRRPLDADALALHPYVPNSGDPRGKGDATGFYLTTIERTVAQVRRWKAQGKMTGGQTWITEFGYGPGAPASWWRLSLQRAERAGVPVMVLYELTQPVDPGKNWDSGLLDRDGSKRGSMRAVEGWIAR